MFSLLWVVVLWGFRGWGLLGLGEVGLKGLVGGHLPLRLLGLVVVGKWGLRVMVCCVEVLFFREKFVLSGFAVGFYEIFQ
jgi:hypothetical protein